MFLIAEDWYFLSHRLLLARACRDQGWEVVIATRTVRHGDTIRSEGFSVIPIRMRRISRAPAAELATIYELISIFAREKPDIVHQVGLKPVIYGSLAGMVTRTGLVVNALAGMGYIFTSGRLWIRVAREIIKFVLWICLRPRRHRLILQNEYDASLLVKNGLGRAVRSRSSKGLEWISTNSCQWPSRKVKLLSPWSAVC